MEELYQFNTLGSLMSGLYDGKKTISSILHHGNFGIGTFDQVEGEMIIMDGIVYQALGNNTIRVADQDQTSPYVAVTNHNADVTFEMTGTHSINEVEKKIESYLTSRNLFHSIKIQGHFQSMKVRMATKTASGTSFDVVSANQPEYMEENISGTIVGFFTPTMFHGMSVAGFHLHFLSEDKKFGGHILDFTSEDLTVEIGQISKIQQDFPINYESFLKQEIDFQRVSGIINITE